MKRPRYVLTFLLINVVGIINAAEVNISSLNELADYASKSGNVITMSPGVYALKDYLSVDSMPARHNSKQFQFITFSGNNNVFKLDGVEIEVDNELRSALKAPLHNSEFLITGSNNTFKGLTIRYKGQGTTLGAAALAVGGKDNVLKNVTLHIKGSFPYGYGDYLGKGPKSVVKHKKHSGLLITGTNTKLYACKVFMRSLGHAFFIQGGNNTYFEDCYAEGQIRPTDQMLAEKSGPAFEHDFASVYRNYLGKKTIPSGYMKSLNECGFRTYATGKVTAINCTAKYMRVGFAFAKASLSNCEAIDCERGYYLNNSVAKDCRGDAKYGPLIYLVGNNSQIDLTLMPGQSDMTVHAVATICGSGHEVSIKSSDQGNRKKATPIMLGYGMPSAGEISSPIPEKAAENITITNTTSMPIVIGKKADSCVVTTNGPVKSNDGLNITIVKSNEMVSTFKKRFVHPGVTHKRSDLDRMKYMVEAKIDPWYSSYKQMAADSKSSYNYVVQGKESFTLLARDAPRTNYKEWNSDIRAAYYNAIRWYVTGESRHAEKAIEIFKAWSNLTAVTSNGTDALSGGVGYIMIEAAELIKSTYDGWSTSDIKAFKDMLVYPGYSNTEVPSSVSRKNSTFYWKSYQGDSYRHGNQGLSGWRTVMAMGIFLDNEIMYDRALRYVKGLPHRPDDLPYPPGPKNGGRAIEDYGYNEVMTNYIWENGQCQESSRDHQHTVFGIGLLCSMAEMAWNQGEDLYGHANDRLLLGLEYNMRYNVSAIQSYPDQPSPWKPTVASGEFIQRQDRTGRWYSKTISSKAAGGFVGIRTVFEMPVAHYVGRAIKSEEEVKWAIRARDKSIETSGYEVAGWTNDSIGWGALTARRPDYCYGDPISGFSSGLPVYAMNVLPMTIQAENFDYSTVSGQGRIYNDSTPDNSSKQYRSDEDVDIQACSEGGYALADMDNGEWIGYTVYVPSSGTYNLTVRYAAAKGNGTIKFAFNGSDVTGDVALPATGGPTSWASYTVGKVALTKGVQNMRIYVSGTSDSYQLNNITIDHRVQYKN